MKAREVDTQPIAGRSVPEQRLPYHSPALVEYGNVSKLTGGASGIMSDFNAMTPIMSEGHHRGR